MNDQHKKNIAIFASGAGTNAANIIQYFKKKQTATVALIVCNNPGAGVLKIAEQIISLHCLLKKKNFLKLMLMCLN